MRSAQGLAPRYLFLPLVFSALSLPSNAISDVACRLVSEGGTCDVIVSLPPSTPGSIGVYEFNGISKGALPGDRICLPAGDYPHNQIVF
jgi:hypothetical protein